jgi:hypothetical protein
MHRVFKECLKRIIFATKFSWPEELKLVISLENSQALVSCKRQVARGQIKGHGRSDGDVEWWT